MVSRPLQSFMKLRRGKVAVAVVGVLASAALAWVLVTSPYPAPLEQRSWAAALLVAAATCWGLLLTRRLGPPDRCHHTVPLHLGAPVLRVEMK